MVYDSWKAGNEIGKNEVVKFRPNLESDCWSYWKLSKFRETFQFQKKLSNLNGNFPTSDLPTSRSFQPPFQLHPDIAYIIYHNIIYHTNLPVQVSSRLKDSLNQMVQVQDPQQEVWFSFRLNLRLDLCINYFIWWIIHMLQF